MRVEGLPAVSRCAGTAYISGVGATLSGPKIPMSVDLVDFLLFVHPDACRPVGGPQRPTRQCAGLILVWTGPLRRRPASRRAPRRGSPAPAGSAYTARPVVDRAPPKHLENRRIRGLVRSLQFPRCDARWAYSGAPASHHTR